MTERARSWPALYTIVLLLCAAVFISYLDRTTVSFGALALQAQLGWNATQKGLVLFSFFIGYILLMVASGTIANRFGGRVVLGVAVVWWSLFTALTPAAAVTSFPVLITVRIALGIGVAALFPASFNMIGRWVSPLQRSRAVTLVVSSLSLATVFALPMTHRLVRCCGWSAPFYVFGAIGILWAAGWSAGVRSGYGTEPPVSSVQPGIPWGRLLRLPAVWAIIVAHSCYAWSTYVLLTWLPSHFKNAFGAAVVNGSMLLAAPWFAHFLMANVAGHLADRLLRAGRSATLVRKLMQTIGLGVGGMFLLLLPAAGSVTAATVLMCCAGGSLAFCLAGFAPNSFDIAPGYADVIYAISNPAAILPGIVGVFVTEWLVDRTGSFAAPFFMAAGIAFLGTLVYLAIGSGVRRIH